MLEVQDELVLRAPGLTESLQALEDAIAPAQVREREAAQAHTDAVSELFGACKAYNETRRAAILKEFAHRRLSWCTRCQQTCPSSETQLMFCEGRHQFSCGYENGDYGSRDYSELHRTCAACRSKLTDFDEKARYGNERNSRRSYIVESRDGAYWVGDHRLVRKNSWEEPYAVPEEPPEKLIESLAAQWHIPKALELKTDRVVGTYEVVKVPYKKA